MIWSKEGRDLLKMWALYCTPTWHIGKDMPITTSHYHLSSGWELSTVLAT